MIRIAICDDEKEMSDRTAKLASDFFVGRIYRRHCCSFPAGKSC